jgi:hypothetical protein
VIKSDRFHPTSYTVFAQLWYNQPPSERSSLVRLPELDLRFLREEAIASDTDLGCQKNNTALRNYPQLA